MSRDVAYGPLDLTSPDHETFAEFELYLFHAKHVPSLRRQMPTVPRSEPDGPLADEVKASGTIWFLRRAEWYFWDGASVALFCFSVGT